MTLPRADEWFHPVHIHFQPLPRHGTMTLPHAEVVRVVMKLYLALAATTQIGVLRPAIAAGTMCRHGVLDAVAQRGKAVGSSCELALVELSWRV